MKRFEYSPLHKELKAQTYIAKKQYRNLENTSELDKIIKEEKPTLKKYNGLDLIYDSTYSFIPYYNIKHFNSLSLVSRYPILFSFYGELNKFNNINPRQVHTKEKKVLCMAMLQNYVIVSRNLF